MNDRERIARAIHEAFQVQCDFDPAADECLPAADAVLAAIGDRIIPELPEDMTADVYVELDVVGGRGITVAEAVRDAIGQREAYKRLEEAGAL